MKREELVEHFFNSEQSLQRAWKLQFQKVLGNEGLSLAQMGMLFMIKNRQPIKASDLAKELQISRSAVTQLMEPLNRQHYITREEDSQDRRIQYIKLSDNGVKELARLEKIRKDFFARSITSLTDEELETIVRIQRKMIHEIE